MARVMTGGELANIRKDGQWAKLRLAIFMPDTIMTARVNGDPASDDEIAQVTIDAAVFQGAYSSAPFGCLVYVGSAAGLYDKGMVRLRATLTGAPTTLKFGEISEIDWDDDDYITVVDEMPIAPRHIRLTSTNTFMDYDIDYTDQHLYPDPVPVFGPTVSVALLAPDEVIVNFDSSDSWALDGGGLTYSWSFPNSASTTGLATDSPTATYNAAGNYRADCTVSRDYGGGNVKTTTGYRYIIVLDPTNLPSKEFTLENCSGSWDSQGWSFRITMYADATRTDIRDRALVCLFAEDHYGSTKTSIGPITDRETIVCVGWIAGESIAWDIEANTVSFEVQGPQYWLNQMQGFPSGVEDVQTTPTEWTEFDTLDLRSGLWHFLHWRTTATRIMDIQLTSDTTGISLFNASPGTLWGQISGESEATIYAHPCCDRFGRLFVEVEPQLIPVGSRTGPTVHALQGQDLRRPVSIERQTVARVGQVDLSGIVYSAGSGAAKFSLTPGHVPGWLGPGMEGPTRLALTSQAQANALAGLLLDWQNNLYPNVTLPLASNHRMLDICPQQYVTLSLLTGDTLRGIVWSNQKLLPRSVSFNYDHRSGVLLTDVESEAVSADLAGIDGDVPPTSPPSPGYPSYNPPAAWDPQPPQIEWPTTVYVGTETSGVYYTADFTAPDDATQPTWATANTGLPATDLRQLLLDPFDKSSRQYCLLETARSVHVQESGTWASGLTVAQACTLAGCATGNIGFIAIDEQTDGRVYALFDDTTAGARRLILMKSDSYGANGTWAIVKVVFTNVFGSRPSSMRADGAYIYLGTNRNAGGQGYVYSSADTGGSFTASATLGTSTWDPWVHLNLLANTFCWVNELSAFGPVTYDLTKIVGVVKTRFQDALDIGPLRPGAMWFSVDDANYQRILKSDSIYVTTDAWTSVVDSTPGTISPATCKMLAARVSDDDDMILLGADPPGGGTTPHHILAMLEDDNITPVGKAGTNAGTGPYTDAIPETAGGICYDGIQVVE